MATGAPRTSAGGRAGVREGRWAGPGRRVSSGLRRPPCSPLPHRCQGRDSSPARPDPRPPSRRARASPGGRSGGLQKSGSGSGLLTPPRRSPPTRGPSRQNLSPMTTVRPKLGKGKELWLSNALLTGSFLCILFHLFLYKSLQI